MYLTILGRQPEISLAELERIFGGDNVSIVSNQSATLNADHFDIQKLGGIPKAGKIILELPKSNWHKISQRIVQHYQNKFTTSESKITFGISVYGANVNGREIQKTGIILKQKLKKSGISLRLIPNNDSVLNTAVSHHNKLGLSSNKIELLVAFGSDKIFIAESTGAQNITAYANRDQKRPKRDAFVGMLPPKLAQTMINLATDGTVNSNLIILDPFCGTGVVLQEASLLGYRAYGTDLSEKMIDYSLDNMKWLDKIYHKNFDYSVHQGDAMDTVWQQPIDFVVGETYLGQPFSAPPSPEKLKEVVKNCNYIIGEFLKNLSKQAKPGTQICIAVPAWRDNSGNFTHLPLTKNLSKLGYQKYTFKNIKSTNLLYYRNDQVVARELLVISRI